MSSVNRLHRRLWAAVRLRVIERDGYRCTRCGKAGRLEVHHEVPVGMIDDPYAESNLRTLCRRCHIDVHRPTSYRTKGRKQWKERLKHGA